MKRIIFRTTDDTKDLTKFERKPAPISNSNLRKNDPITENYELTKEVLGRGFQTFVYIGLNKISRKKYAIKLIEINSESLAEYEKEKSILKELEHPNIIHLIEVYETNFNYYFVMELCLGGNLNTLLKKCPEGRLLPSVSRLIILQLSQAILYCHERGICHRDIKLQNILLENEISDDICLNNNISIKLSSFRTSIKYKSKLPLTRPTGSINIRAPEVFKNNYDEKCDIWSLGVVTYCLLSGRYPFEYIEFPYHPQSRDISLITNIILHRLHFNQECWAVMDPCAIDFIRGCLEYNPNKRFTALEVIEQSWFTGEKRKVHSRHNNTFDVEGGESEGDIITISRLHRSTRSISKSFLRTSSRVSVISSSTNTNSNTSPTSYPPGSTGSHYTMTGSPMSPTDTPLQVAWDLQDHDTTTRNIPLLQQRHWDDDEPILNENNNIGYSRPPSPRPPLLSANSFTTFTSILKTKNIQLRKRLSQYFPGRISEDSGSSSGNTSSISKDQFISLLSVIVPMETLDNVKDILLEAIQKDGGEAEYTLLDVLAVVVDQREIDMKQLNEALRLLDLEGKGYLTSDDLERALIHIAELKRLVRNTTTTITATTTTTANNNSNNNNNSRRNSLKISNVDAMDSTAPFATPLLSTLSNTTTTNTTLVPISDNSLTSEKRKNPVTKLFGKLKLHPKHKSNKSKQRETTNEQEASQQSLLTSVSPSHSKGGDHGGVTLNLERLQKIILSLIAQSDFGTTTFSYKDFIFLFMDTYNLEDRLPPSSSLPTTTPPTSIRRHSFNNSNSSTVKKSLSFRHSLVTEVGDTDYNDSDLTGTAIINGLYGSGGGGGGVNSETKSATSRSNSFRISPSLLLPSGQYGINGTLPHVLDGIPDDTESIHLSPQLSLNEEEFNNNNNSNNNNSNNNNSNNNNNNNNNNNSNNNNSNNNNNGGSNIILKKNGTVKTHNTNLNISETINSIAQSLVAACTFKGTGVAAGTDINQPKKSPSTNQRLVVDVTPTTAPPPVTTTTQKIQQDFVVECLPRSHSSHAPLDSKMQSYEIARRRSFPRPHAIIDDDNNNDTFDETDITAPITSQQIPLTRTALRNRGHVPPLWESESPSHPPHAPPSSIDGSYHTKLQKENKSKAFRSSSSSNSNETDHYYRSEYYVKNKSEVYSNPSNISSDHSNHSYLECSAGGNTATAINLHNSASKPPKPWNDCHFISTTTTTTPPHRRCHSDDYLSHLKNKNKLPPPPLPPPYKPKKSPPLHDTNNNNNHSFHHMNSRETLRKRATSWILSEIIGTQSSEKRFSSIAPSTSYFE